MNERRESFTTLSGEPVRALYGPEDVGAFDEETNGEIADAAYELQREIERGDRIVVGINDYREGDDQPPEILTIDPALERKQIGRVQAVRARRQSEPVERALAELAAAAADDDRNLMPNLLRCAGVHATEGEIVEALQDVCGNYTESPAF